MTLAATKVTYTLGQSQFTSLIDPNAVEYRDVKFSYTDKHGKLIEQTIILPSDAAIELGAYMGDKHTEETLLDFRNRDDAWYPGWGALTLPIIARKIAKFTSMHLTHMTDKLKYVHIKVNMKTGGWMLLNADNEQKNKEIFKMIDAGDPSGLKSAS